jgi:hypothetical protein
MRASLTLIVVLFTMLAACRNRDGPLEADSGRACAGTSHTATAPCPFLRARLRGAIDADLAWNDPNLVSEGGARPDGSGIRVSLAGELRPGGQRMRLVFGIGTPPGQSSVRAVPTNLTLILEGANRVYATLGDDKCSVDALTQQPVAVSGDAPAAGDYWVNARGFCMEPAATLDGSEHVLISRFDFRGRIHLEESDLRVTAPDR